MSNVVCPLSGTASERLRTKQAQLPEYPPVDGWPTLGRLLSGADSLSA